MSKTEIKITTENDDKTKNCEEPFNFLDFPNIRGDNDLSGDILFRVLKNRIYLFIITM